MQIVETLNEGLKRAYTLTVTAKDIDARVDEEVKSVAPTVRMPGFRPGKVPANLVRKMHGAALQREALDKSIRDGVEKILSDNKLRPAMQPSVELANDYEEGKDAEVKVELEVLPAVPTPKIDEIKLERLIVEVADEQVDEAVARLAAQSQRFDDAPADTAAKDGDQVVMDFVGKVDGVAFDGGTGTGMAIVIGSGNLIPGFEEQLVGVKAGEEKTINVNFPEEYGAKNLAGKAATFDLVITAVKHASEKPADDEFAKQLGLESLDKLRELLKAQLEQENGNLTRTFMKRRLLDQLAASHDFEVPPGMVEAEFGQIWSQLEHEAAQEEDKDAALAEMESDRDDYRSIAERRVRLGLLLSEIGQANGVEITQAEMNRLMAQAAQQYPPQDRERFVEYVRNEPMAAAQLRAPLYEDKVVDFLFGKADVTERIVERADLEAAIESEDADFHVHGPDCNHDHAHGADAKPAKKAAPKKAAAKKDDAAEVPAQEAKAPAKKAAAKKAPADERKADEAAPAKKPAARKSSKKADAEG